MRLSHPVPHIDGGFQLPIRVREWLQLPRKCLLHGKLVNDSSESTAAVLSPIPEAYWDRCFRVTLYTVHHAGSLHRVLSALEDMQLTVLYLLTSAVSSRGELCVSAVVAPSDPAFDPRRPSIHATTIELALSNALEDVLLNDSDLFRPAHTEDTDNDRYRVVKCWPLLLLRALSSAVPSPDGLGRYIGDRFNSSFVFQMDNSTIDLKRCILLETTKASSPDSSRRAREPQTAFSCMTASAPWGHSAMVTADASECHLRVCLLPAKPFMVVTAEVQTTSPLATGLCGIGRSLTGALAAPPDAFNIYHASLFISQRTDLSLSPGTFTERMKYRAIGEIARPELTSVSTLETDLSKDFVDALEAHPSKPSLVQCGIRHMQPPLVFLSTNLKAGVDRHYLDMGLELCRHLREMYLQPVFLEELQGTPLALQQMARLLDMCPVLVSFIVPEPRLCMHSERKRGKQRRSAYAAPAWPIFEEAYVAAQGRPVYRLIHEIVYSAPNHDQITPLVFGDHISFIDALTRLKSRLNSEQGDERWLELLRKCKSALEHHSIGPREIMAHDPEQKFLQYLSTDP